MLQTSFGRLALASFSPLTVLGNKLFLFSPPGHIHLSLSLSLTVSLFPPLYFSSVSLSSPLSSPCSSIIFPQKPFQGSFVKAAQNMNFTWVAHSLLSIHPLTMASALFPYSATQTHKHIHPPPVQAHTQPSMPPKNQHEHKHSFTHAKRNPRFSSSRNMGARSIFRKQMKYLRSKTLWWLPDVLLIINHVKYFWSCEY